MTTMLSRDILAGEKLRITTNQGKDPAVFPTNSIFWNTSTNKFYDDVVITNTSTINNNFHIYLTPHTDISLVVAGEGGTFTIKNPTQPVFVRYGGHASKCDESSPFWWAVPPERRCADVGCGGGNSGEGFGGNVGTPCPGKSYTFNPTGNNTYSCDNGTFGNPVAEARKQCRVQLKSSEVGIMYQVTAINSSSSTTVEYQNEVNLI